MLAFQSKNQSLGASSGLYTKLQDISLCFTNRCEMFVIYETEEVGGRGSIVSINVLVEVNIDLKEEQLFSIFQHRLAQR